jgi:hypothetical protein
LVLPIAESSSWATETELACFLDELPAVVDCCGEPLLMLLIEGLSAQRRLPSAAGVEDAVGLVEEWG